MAAKASKGPAGIPDVRTFLAEGGALTRGMAVIAGTAENQVKAPGSVATGNLKVKGIVVEDALEDAPVKVCIDGECIMIADDVIAHGDQLKTVDANGKATATTTDNDGIYGEAVSDAAADGDEFVGYFRGASRY